MDVIDTLYWKIQKKSSFYRLVYKHVIVFIIQKKIYKIDYRNLII